MIFINAFCMRIINKYIEMVAQLKIIIIKEVCFWLRLRTYTLTFTKYTVSEAWITRNNQNLLFDVCNKQIYNIVDKNPQCRRNYIFYFVQKFWCFKVFLLYIHFSDRHNKWSWSVFSVYRVSNISLSLVVIYSWSCCVQ